ncbi:MAG TPA: thioredoxin family protein [Rhodoferax sp.]|jgi:thiol-disulfide isomerase/thioredoxin|nr:thioredoxin family protein [Rhodoferax sp.]
MKFAHAALTLCLSTAFSLAVAGQIVPYNQQTFDHLTADGKPVVLDISATWCPTCKAQKPIVENIMKQPAFSDVTLMRIDFDSQKPLLRKYHVTMQSTLVAFKGETEVGRSVGDTSRAGLQSLFEKTVH